MIKHVVDRLDERVPWMRRHPEVVALLVAVVFLGGAVLHSVRTQGPPDAVARSGGDPAAGRASDPASYRTQRTAVLERLAADDAQAIGVATASFVGYLTPRAAAEVANAAGVEVLAAHVRLRTADAPPADAHVDFLPRQRVKVTGNLLPTLAAALRHLGEQAGRQAAELDTLAASTQDPAFAETFLADRDVLLAAARTPPERCACVHAIEVRAAFGRLLELNRDPRLQLVDAADPATRQLPSPLPAQ